MLADLDVICSDVKGCIFSAKVFIVVLMCLMLRWQQTQILIFGPLFSSLENEIQSFVFL